MLQQRLVPAPAAATSTASVPKAGRLGAELVPGGQVGRLTRWVALAVIFFLADAVQLLLLLPDRTGELFAWAIAPQVTSFVLAAAYVAGAYFFIRVVTTDSWHRVAAGFPAVIVFVWGAAGATALHLDRFSHDALAFAAWAGIYAVAPVGLPLLYLARRRAARVPLADTPMSARTRLLLGCVGGAVVLLAVLAFALPQTMIAVWPWTLTPLTARIVATVMALFGSLWVSVALSGGRTAARIPLEAHALGLAFLLIAALRGSGDIEWTNPLAAVLVGGVAAMVLVDVVTLARSRR